MILGFASILALVAGATCAMAGELSLKDPIPGNLTWRGVTFYGALDIDYAYLAHGAPLNGALATGLTYNAISQARNANGPISSLAQAGLEANKLGVRIEQPVAGEWTAIARLETGFQPLSGELSDFCASLARNNGVPLTEQTSNLNGSRCGQLFNGQAYAGVSSFTYGTLTAGWQHSLGVDAQVVYDPMALSSAFSLIGGANASAAAFGNAEEARWANSVKYVYVYGPAHAAAMYTMGGEGTAMFGGGYGFDAGVTWRGFSVDAVYALQRTDILTSFIPYNAFGAPGTCDARGGQGNVCPGPKFINGTVFDSEGWSVMGKYTHDLGGGDEWPGGKLSLYTGYVHIQLTNPTQLVTPGSHTLGGYVLYSVNNQPFAPGSARIVQVAWAGARYELPSGITFAAAYYFVNQQAFLANTAQGIRNCAEATADNRGNPAFVGFPAGANCPGDITMGALMVDYALNKHFDVYGGINHSTISGGFTSGYLNDNNTVFLSGMRLRF